MCHVGSLCSLLLGFACRPGIAGAREAERTPTNDRGQGRHVLPRRLALRVCPPTSRGVEEEITVVGTRCGRRVLYVGYVTGFDRKAIVCPARRFHNFGISKSRKISTKWWCYIQYFGTRMRDFVVLLITNEFHGISRLRRAGGAQLRHMYDANPL